jgi:hypothetical protein
MSLGELETIKKEFEEITKLYRVTASMEGRLALTHRIEKLMYILKQFEVLGDGPFP